MKWLYSTGSIVAAGARTNRLFSDWFLITFSFVCFWFFDFDFFLQKFNFCVIIIALWINFKFFRQEKIINKTKKLRVWRLWDDWYLYSSSASLYPFIWPDDEKPTAFFFVVVLCVWSNFHGSWCAYGFERHNSVKFTCEFYCDETMCMAICEYKKTNVRKSRIKC